MQRRLWKKVNANNYIGIYKAVKYKLGVTNAFLNFAMEIFRIQHLAHSTPW